MKNKGEQLSHTIVFIALYILIANHVRYFSKSILKCLNAALIRKFTRKKRLFIGRKA